jgi:hypothetical protein
MPADPATDLGRVVASTVVEPAVLITACWCVIFGLGVPEQHQTAHRGSRFGSSTQIYVQTNAQDKVTSA